MIHYQNMSMLNKKTVVELRQLCKRNDVKRYYRLRKAMLIDILEKLYVHRIVSWLILNKYKKSKNITETQSTETNTCNICLDNKICVKICSCNSCVCLSCIENIRNPEICCLCRCDTEQYLRSLKKTGRTDLQTQALVCILDKKITPIPTIPPPIITHVRPPRTRVERANIIIQFVRNTDQRFYSWYTNSLRQNIDNVDNINGIMHTYHFLITGLLQRRTFPASQRDMLHITRYLDLMLN